MTDIATSGYLSPLDYLTKSLAQQKTKSTEGLRHKLVGYGRLDPGAVTAGEADLDQVYGSLWEKGAQDIYSQYLPMVTSGYLSKDYLPGLTGIKTAQELEQEQPEWGTATKGGYANPFEMMLAIEHPDWYQENIKKTGKKTRWGNWFPG